MFIEQADDSPHKLDASIVVFLHQRPLRVQGSQSVFSVFLDKQCIIYLEDANFTITRCIVTLNKHIALIWKRGFHAVTVHMKNQVSSARNWRRVEVNLLAVCAEIIEIEPCCHGIVCHRQLNQLNLHFLHILRVYACGTFSSQKLLCHAENNGTVRTGKFAIAAQ